MTSYSSFRQSNGRRGNDGGRGGRRRGDDDDSDRLITLRAVTSKGVFSIKLSSWDSFSDLCSCIQERTGVVKSRQKLLVLTEEDEDDGEDDGERSHSTSTTKKSVRKYRARGRQRLHWASLIQEYKDQGGLKSFSSPRFREIGSHAFSSTSLHRLRLFTSRSILVIEKKMNLEKNTKNNGDTKSDNHRSPGRHKNDALKACRGWKSPDRRVHYHSPHPQSHRALQQRVHSLLPFHTWVREHGVQRANRYHAAAGPSVFFRRESASPFLSNSNARKMKAEGDIVIRAQPYR